MAESDKMSGAPGYSSCNRTLFSAAGPCPFSGGTRFRRNGERQWASPRMHHPADDRTGMRGLCCMGLQGPLLVCSGRGGRSGNAEGACPDVLCRGRQAGAVVCFDCAGDGERSDVGGLPVHCGCFSRLARLCSRAPGAARGGAAVRGAFPGEPETLSCHRVTVCR